MHAATIRSLRRKASCKCCNNSFHAVHSTVSWRIMCGMKVLHATVGAVALLAMMCVSSPASAGGRGGARVSVVVGAPVWGPGVWGRPVWGPADGAPGVRAGERGVPAGVPGDHRSGSHPDGRNPAHLTSCIHRTRRACAEAATEHSLVVLLSRLEGVLPVRQGMRRWMAAGRPTTAVLTMPQLSRRLAPLALILLGACAIMPTGPQVLALPGSTKTFDQFRADDASCREFALQQVGGVTPSQAAANAGVGAAVVGTAIGAAAGAAIGGGSGAATGAGVGLVTGTAVGAGYGYDSAWTLQMRYDQGYLQCMYAYGHKVPVSRAYTQSREQASYPPPNYPPPNYPPPPNQPPPTR